MEGTIHWEREAGFRFTGFGGGPAWWRSSEDSTVHAVQDAALSKLSKSKTSLPISSEWKSFFFNNDFLLHLSASSLPN